MLNKVYMTDHKKIKVGCVVILKGKKYKKQINKIGIVTNILTPNKVLSKQYSFWFLLVLKKLLL